MFSPVSIYYKTQAQEAVYTNVFSSVNLLQNLGSRDHVYRCLLQCQSTPITQVQEAVYTDVYYSVNLIQNPGSSGREYRCLLQCQSTLKPRLKRPCIQMCYPVSIYSINPDSRGRVYRCSLQKNSAFCYKTCGFISLHFASVSQTWLIFGTLVYLSFYSVTFFTCWLLSNLPTQNNAYLIFSQAKVLADSNEITLYCSSRKHTYIILVTLNPVFWGLQGYTLFFLFLHKNIDCRFSLELPRRSGSNEYTQSMFRAEI